MKRVSLRRRRSFASTRLLMQEIPMDAQLKRPGSTRVLAALTMALVLLTTGIVRADRFSTIDRVRGSVVAIGTLERTRSPQFQFLGTGFAVGDGSLIVTNAHVVPPVLDVARGEQLAVMLPSRIKDAKDEAQIRDGKPLVVDSNADLAVIKISGPPLPSLRIRDSDSVRDGREIV